MPALHAAVHALRGQAFDIHGERVVALPQRALWWPARETIVVADLHLGKGESYRALGVPIPEALLGETLERLADAISLTRATRVIVVGDFVHAALGLTPNVRQMVATAMKAVGARMTVVRGNHDLKVPRMPAEWPIELHDPPFDEPPFCFVHEPAAVRDRYTIAGHLHPTFTLTDGRDAIRMPCFHFGPRIGVLPAFSMFTRGVPMSAEVGDRVYVVAEGDVVDVTPE